MNRTNDLKAIIALSLAVMMLSGASFFILIGEPTTQRPTNTASLRKPASAVADSQPSEKGLAQSLTLDCANPTTAQILTDSDRIQIKGTNCKKQTTDIKNVSTGYTASMFFPKGETFLTDFIQLKEGRNEIQIAGVSGDYIELIVQRKKSPPTGRTF